MTERLARVRTAAGAVRVALIDETGVVLGYLAGVHTLADCLRLPLAELRALLERTGRSLIGQPAHVLAPIDGETEVWAAGVTYKRSEAARVEESATPDVYSRVYRAQRPELFFKANARRVAGPGEAVRVRSDSTWDVPEPELALVLNTAAEIVGYTISNDVSSRSIEGENPLYLPQAKVYARSCALGPAITPVWAVADPYQLRISMQIARGSMLHWQGETSMREFARRLDDLVAYLFREDTFPDGAILSTGTALVPDSPFSLQPGDAVSIQIDGLGELRNTVTRGVPT